MQNECCWLLCLTSDATRPTPRRCHEMLLYLHASHLSRLYMHAPHLPRHTCDPPPATCPSPRDMHTPHLWCISPLVHLTSGASHLWCISAHVTSFLGSPSGSAASPAASLGCISAHVTSLRGSPSGSAHVTSRFGSLRPADLSDEAAGAPVGERTARADGLEGPGVAAFDVAGVAIEVLPQASVEAG